MSGREVTEGRGPSSASARSTQAAPVASTTLDRWALGWIQRTVASAPIRFVLWDGFDLPSVTTLREVFEHVLEPHAFSVLDVENLRLHYAKTLEHWRQRFNASAHQVAAMFDDTFVRAWDRYLAGSQASFSTGCMRLFQVVLARGSSDAGSWTRVSG